MRTLVIPCAIVLTMTISVAQDAPKDSLADLKDGNAIIRPVARIQPERLSDCSGMHWWKGAWWAHNDRGDGPALYRADTPDFKDAQRITLPGATAVDWQALATLGDDLMICDIADSYTRRDDLAIYRAGYSDGKLSLLARYAMRYPDGPRDAEAAFTLDGKLHVVTRPRGDGMTVVYRFNELKTDEPNTAEAVAKLDLDKRTIVTAADCDGAHVVLLSYTRVFVYAADKLEGAPLSSTRIYAGRCKAACLHEGRLVFTSQQRDVYAINDFLTRGVKNALPEAVRVELPREKTAYDPDGSGEAWKAGAATLPLRGLGEGEFVRWMISGGWLMLAGAVRYDSFTSSSEDGPRHGSALVLMLGTGDDDFLRGDERFYWLGDNGITGLDVWSMDATSAVLKPLPGAVARGSVRAGWMRFEYALPLTRIFGEGELPAEFRVNLWGFNLKGKQEPHLAGASFACRAHPYTWAHAKVVKK